MRNSKMIVTNTTPIYTTVYCIVLTKKEEVGTPKKKEEKTDINRNVQN